MAYYKYFRSTPKNLIYLKIYSFIKYYRRKIMRGNMQKNYLVENYGFSFSFKYYLVFNINITDSKKKTRYKCNYQQYCHRGGILLVTMEAIV